jgi:hypothetical protein
MGYNSPSWSRGVLPFKNAQKWSIFQVKSVFLASEMMGFLLPYDLGIMNNCFNGLKGWIHLKK